MTAHDQAPSGFKEINVGGFFISHNGPLYAAIRNKQFVMGMRIEQHHCNPNLVCHGGMLSAFADMLLPYGAMYALGINRRFTPTISLQLDFLAPVNLGSWIDGTCEPLRSTSNLLFVRGLIKHKDEVVVRASGLFKWGDFVPSEDPLNPFGLVEN
jgi:uncharacterized protein (TIGR00369 family)